MNASRTKTRKELEQKKNRSGLKKNKPGAYPPLAKHGPISNIYSLHKTIGNRAVGSLIKAKLKIVQPNDPLELEADRVAEQIVEMKEPATCLRGSNVAEADKSSDQVQKKPNPANSGTNLIPNDLTRDLGPGNPLDTPSRSSMEHRFGQDFSQVRVHTDAHAASVARSVKARAFTLGKDIVFGSGKYLPGTREGKHLLAHELTHVIQQRPGINSHDTGAQIHASVQKPMQAEITNTKSQSLMRTEQPGSSSLQPQERKNPWERRLLHLEGDWLREITISHRGIEGWRSFLKNADDERNALELNAFLALATSHPDYIQTPAYKYKEVTPWSPPEIIPPSGVISKPRKPQPKPKPERIKVQELRRRYLSRISPPSKTECINLMVAFLSTPDIDLREIGGLSPALGYLVPRFTEKYYHLAIQYIAGMAGSSPKPEEVAKWQIAPAAVADLLEEAGESVFGGAFSDTKELEPGLRRAKAPPRPNKLHEIGVAGKEAGPSPADVLQATALAGAQMASILALGEALVKEEEEAGTIADRYRRQITAHAQVLSGVILYQDRIREMEEMILNIAFRTIVAGLGGYLGTLSAFSLAVGKTGISGAVEIGKQGVSLMVKELGGLSGKELRSNFKRSFNVTIQAKINAIRQNSGSVPNRVSHVVTSLLDAFDYHL